MFMEFTQWRCSSNWCHWNWVNFFFFDSGMIWHWTSFPLLSPSPSLSLSPFLLLSSLHLSLFILLVSYPPPKGTIQGVEVYGMMNMYQTWNVRNVRNSWKCLKCQEFREMSQMFGIREMSQIPEMSKMPNMSMWLLNIGMITNFFENNNFFGESGKYFFWEQFFVFWK